MTIKRIINGTETYFKLTPSEEEQAFKDYLFSYFSAKLLYESPKYHIDRDRLEIDASRLVDMVMSDLDAYLDESDNTVYDDDPHEND